MSGLLHNLAIALVAAVIVIAVVNTLFPVRLSDSDWERWS